MDKRRNTINKKRRILKRAWRTIDPQEKTKKLPDANEQRSVPNHSKRYIGMIKSVSNINCKPVLLSSFDCITAREKGKRINSKKL